MTVERRMYLALKTKKSLIDVGVPPEDIAIVEGYDFKDMTHLKRNYHCIGLGFFHFWLPAAQSVDEDCYYMECGTLVKENPLLIEKVKGKVNWLGYIFNQKSYTCGSKLIYFPKEILKDWEEPKKQAHFDRLIRNKFEKDNKLYIALKSIVYQEKYESDWGTKWQKKWKSIYKSKLDL